MPQSFWHIDLGNVTSWLVLLFAAIAFVRRFSRRIDLMEDSIRNSSKTLDKVASLVDQMNLHGTQWSQAKIASEILLQQDQSRRLQDVEKVYKEQSPQIATLVADVGWIKHHFQKIDSGKI